MLKKLPYALEEPACVWYSLHMRDYFKEYLELLDEFGTEDSCRRYLYSLRWSEGFCCPNCGPSNAWKISPIKYKCKGCLKQTSLYTGTLFQGTHQPLTHWFRAIGYVIIDPNQTNALELQKVARLGSYHTALNWWKKLREIMFNSRQYRLRGEITFFEFLENAVNLYENPQ